MDAYEKDSDTVLERTRVREVAGIFHARDALDEFRNSSHDYPTDRAPTVSGGGECCRFRLGVPASYQMRYGY